VLAQILIGIIMCRPLADKSRVECQVIDICKRIIRKDYWPSPEEDYEKDYELCRTQLNELFGPVLNVENFNSRQIAHNDICYTYKVNEAVVYKAAFVQLLFNRMKIRHRPFDNDTVMNVFVVFAKPFKVEQVVLDEYVVIEDDEYN